MKRIDHSFASNQSPNTQSSMIIITPAIIRDIAIKMKDVTIPAFSGKRKNSPCVMHPPKKQRFHENLQESLVNIFKNLPTYQEPERPVASDRASVLEASAIEHIWKSLQTLSPEHSDQLDEIFSPIKSDSIKDTLIHLWLRFASSEESEKHKIDSEFKKWLKQVKMETLRGETLPYLDLFNDGYFPHQAVKIQESRIELRSYDHILNDLNDQNQLMMAQKISEKLLKINILDKELLQYNFLEIFTKGFLRNQQDPSDPLHLEEKIKAFMLKDLPLFIDASSHFSLSADKILSQLSTFGPGELKTHLKNFPFHIKKILLTHCKEDEGLLYNAEEIKAEINAALSEAYMKQIHSSSTINYNEAAVYLTKCGAEIQIFMFDIDKISHTIVRSERTKDDLPPIKLIAFPTTSGYLWYLISNLQE